MLRLFGSLLASVAFFCALVVPAHANAPDVLRSVDPFVGTSSGAPDFGTGGGAGGTFPGAVLPFGMVQFSPDTAPGADNFAGGYSYRDRLLRGFSLTHFSGAGCAGFGDVPILPTTAAVTSSPAVAGSGDVSPRYLAGFDHRDERASPGAYNVILAPSSSHPISVALTATTRTGDARLVFPARRRVSVLVNAGGSSLANYAASVTVDPAARSISGSVQSGGFCFQPTRYRVYFVVRFDRPFGASGTWNGLSLMRGGRSAAAVNPHAFSPKGVPGGPAVLPGNLSSGVQAGAYASFDTTSDRTVVVRIGISFTSLTEAQRNLARESLGRSFDQLRSAARQSWRAELGKVSVSGGSPRLRSLFYTALYHALIEPSTLSDADGSYPGMDGRVHRAGTTVQYTDISGWDVYRTQVPLLAMLEPRRAADLATSLVRDARQSGCLPRWPYADQQTNVMTGDPSDPMIASIYAFGARAFDAPTALGWMVAGATHPCHTQNGDYTEREVLEDYLRLGYIPQEEDTDAVGHTLGSRQLAWGAAATTLEDALADSAVSGLARRLSRPAIAARFARRGENWQRLFDPRSGYVRPRLRSGAWLAPFAATGQTGFVEGNAVQYTWLVPQDPERLFALMGGAGVARRRLDRFFAALNAGPDRPYAYLGNEPTLATPWLYDWLGEPARATAVIRRALLGLYSPTPGGMPGNDDGGTMSAWWVLGALGLYPAVPGSDLLAINAPLFGRAIVTLPCGRLVIDAPGTSPGRPYIQDATLDGRPLRHSRIHFDPLITGVHRLKYSMGANARSAWGRTG